MNYFNTLSDRQKQKELGKCRMVSRTEFNGVEALKGKKIVILGCGAQGLNQGLNLRDSGLDVSYALRAEAISEQRQSWKNASGNGFAVGTFEEMVPTADLVINLTPDKQHSPVVNHAMPLMKQDACLAYSHGFNIVEEGMQIREDLTVIMVAPKSPGSEVRHEYERGFGVPTLIAVHRDNDPRGEGLELAKAYAAGTGGHHAGVLESSFVAEVKSDLMGEQTILCGMLQAGSLLCYDKMLADGIPADEAAGLLQFGWEAQAEAMKEGGISLMMSCLAPAARVLAHELAIELKEIMRTLFEKHMDDILSGNFSSTMMADWANGDANLLGWREETGASTFENAPEAKRLAPRAYFERGVLMTAMLKAGVELAFEAMSESGIKDESAYYESLHEVPLIANTIARKRLYEMNVTISDTAEYGCYLFANACVPLLRDYVNALGSDVIGGEVSDPAVDVAKVAKVYEATRRHPVEKIGRTLRAYMRGE